LFVIETILTIYDHLCQLHKFNIRNSESIKLSSHYWLAIVCLVKAQILEAHVMFIALRGSILGQTARLCIHNYKVGKMMYQVWRFGWGLMSHSGHGVTNVIQKLHTSFCPYINELVGWLR